MCKEITFRKAISSDKSLIHAWWKKPHVVTFWDNSFECWQNVESYLDQKKKEAFDYWLGFCDGVPFSLIMTCNETEAEDTPPYYVPHLSENGQTLAIDFMIGDEAYLGKGLSHLTLHAFIEFCPLFVTSFIIDVVSDHSKAIHVYQKAGFQEVGRFRAESGYFSGKEHLIMKYSREFLCKVR